MNPVRPDPPYAQRDLAYLTELLGRDPNLREVPLGQAIKQMTTYLDQQETPPSEGVTTDESGRRISFSSLW